MKSHNELLVIMTVAIMACTPLAVNADVFKCTDSNSKIIYQAGPCTKVEGDRIKIKQSSPEEIKETAKKEGERIKIEKEYRMRQAEVNAINAKAQAQTNSEMLLNQMNQKLDKMKRQNIIDKSQQKYDQLQRDLYPGSNR